MENDKKEASVLIIDDDKSLQFGLQRVLEKEGFKVLTALDGMQGNVTAINHTPDLILLDIGLPQINGFEVKNTLNRNPKTQDIPVIFLTAFAEVDNRLKGFNLGSDDYITKPFDINELLARVKTVLRRYHKNTEKLKVNGYQNVDMILEGSIQAMVRSLDLRDAKNPYHTSRVVLHSEVLAKALGISGDRLNRIRCGAMLHDIGKLAIPDSILNKPGPLNDEEWVIMKKHPLYAVDILSHNDAYKDYLDIPRSHHEHWDGSGYPYGLSGEQIPFEARIFSVADIYDALISERPYRKALQEAEVIEIIRRSRGTILDPAIVEIFLCHVNEIRESLHKPTLMQYPLKEILVLE
jgi:putative two-component system response regulator